MEGKVYRVPKKLFYGSRVEVREMIKEDGLYPRVDLLTTPQDAINFLGGPPCDVYEIRSSKLKRKKFIKQDHPMWTLYSYHDHIPTDLIGERTTYR